MHWALAHPYSTSLLAAGLLLVLGVIVVEERSAVTPVRNPIVWGGNDAALLNPSSYTPNPVLRSDGGFNPATTTTLYVVTSSSESPVFNFDSLIRDLSPENQPATQDALKDGIEFAYSFIPSGLVSATTTVRERTEVQQSMYNYGNEAGSYIQSYEDTHRGAALALKNQAEDRRDEPKRAVVRDIGRALARVGRNLESIEDVPDALAAAHKLVTESYVEIGAKLERVPDAESDQAFIAAITEYNAAVELFTKRYVALAKLLSAFGVRFASHESGSVFTFTNTNQ